MVFLIPESRVFNTEIFSYLFCERYKLRGSNLFLGLPVQESRRSVIYDCARRRTSRFRHWCLIDPAGEYSERIIRRSLYLYRSSSFFVLCSYNIKEQLREPRRDSKSPLTDRSSRSSRGFASVRNILGSPVNFTVQLARLSWKRYCEQRDRVIRALLYIPLLIATRRCDEKSENAHATHPFVLSNRTY